MEETEEKIKKSNKGLAVGLIIIAIFLGIVTIANWNKLQTNTETSETTTTQAIATSSPVYYSEEEFKSLSIKGCLSGGTSQLQCDCLYEGMKAHYTLAEREQMTKEFNHTKDYKAPQTLKDIINSCRNVTQTPTLSPTPTDIPMKYGANGFPEDAEAVTVAQIAKVPSAYDGKKLTFTCEVSSFPKNDNGDAAGINCSDPYDSGSLIQVSGNLFDFTKINQGDTVKIYGLGEGAATGKNAFGGDVTEAVVDGLFINDITTGYNDTKE
ncbi:MAG TPA: hypothetical protein VEP90_04510 [Methylomirabilota bacterium]|nr:hypothetical protein [Methylomirabilota bacterium]